jgi:hypothetical protein
MVVIVMTVFGFYKKTLTLLYNIAALNNGGIIKKAYEHK